MLPVTYLDENLRLPRSQHLQRVTFVQAEITENFDWKRFGRDHIRQLLSASGIATRELRHRQITLHRPDRVDLMCRTAFFAAPAAKPTESLCRLIASCPKFIPN